MIDARDITIATRDQLHTDVTVGADRRVRDAEGRIFQPEYRFIKFGQHLVIMADDRRVIDLRKHRSSQETPLAVPNSFYRRRRQFRSNTAPKPANSAGTLRPQHLPSAVRGRISRLLASPCRNVRYPPSHA